MIDIDDLHNLDLEEIERHIQLEQEDIEDIMEQIRNLEGIQAQADQRRRALIAERERRTAEDRREATVYVIDRCPACGALIDPEAGPTCHCDPDA